MDNRSNYSWRILSAIMMGVTGCALGYGLAVVLISKDPLAGVFIPLVVVPSAIPLVFSAFMWRGHRWALIALRASIIFVLAAGVVLNLVAELNVFGFPPFAVPLITFCIAWLLFSLKCKGV